MKVAIFVGPTLPKEEIKEILPDAWILPPAEQGDIEFAHRCGATVIGLIDGVHRQRLPVWHKEILHVLKDGCRFIGAASMGAIRAVECEPWGAEPVGEVAKWYADGTLDADDAVCLTHGDKSSGYRKLSLPLVNVRATMMAARVEKARSEALNAIADGIFYADRTWARIFDMAESDFKERSQILDCELDIKAADALHLCYYISSLPERVSARREIRNSSKGFGQVFLNNDRKVWTGKKILRQHQIALPSFRDAALTRALALQYCKLVGLCEDPPTSVGGLPLDDISDEDSKRLCAEERTLARAREWYSAAGGGFQDVPKTLDFMRVIGAYGQAKEMTR